MVNLINIEKLRMNKSKAIQSLATLLIGIAPETYLRGAKAQAEADATKRRTKARSKVEVSDILQDADRNQRFAEQLRLASILQKAVPEIRQNANPNKIDPDWIENFRSKGRYITSDDMQAFWAHLLSSETNRPGSFSKRTVNIVADMDRRDATMFSNLCRFLWTIDGEPILIVDDIENKIYRENGVTYSHLRQLESLGLITIGQTGQRFQEDCEIVAQYFGNTHTIRREKHKVMPLGLVSLTRSGTELTTIVNAEPVAGYFEHCRILLVSWVTQNR